MKLVYQATLQRVKLAGLNFYNSIEVLNLLQLIGFDNDSFLGSLAQSLAPLGIIQRSDCFSGLRMTNNSTTVLKQLSKLTDKR